MSERYNKLFSLEDNLYTEGSPVIIQAGALQKDNQSGKVLVQLRFKNISDKVIECISVKITSFDTAGRQLEDVVEYQYLDLHAKRDAEFGSKQPIYLSNITTRSFNVSLTEVVFSDKSIWQDANAKWDMLKIATPVTIREYLERDYDLIEQYELNMGNNCAYRLPEKERGLWICGCDAINHSDEEKCHRCARTFDEIIQSLDVDMLRSQAAERLELKRQEEEKIRLANEKAKQERLDKINDIKDKIKNFILYRSKKNIIITVIVVALIIGIGIVCKSNVIPNKIASVIYNDYKISHRTYENAISKLDFIDKFCDVQWAYDKCEALNNSRYAYKTGVGYLEDGQHLNALIEFTKVIQEDENYNDAAQKIGELIVTVKNNAINKLKEFETTNNFYDALALIEGIEKAMVLDEDIREYKRVFTDAKNVYEEEQRIKKELESCDLTSPYGIHKYIKLKYGVLKGTPLGDWEFDVDVHENDVDYISYDYRITLNVDPTNTNLTDLKYSNKVPQEDRVETDNMLKTHMYNLAVDIISKLPNKKFHGSYWEGYDNSDYVDMFYPWSNYIENYSSDYYSTKPGAFRWEPYYSGSFLD